MRTFVLIFVFLSFGFANNFGTITKIVGEGFVNGKQAKLNQKVDINQTLSTGANSKMLVVFGGSAITLGKNASLRVSQENAVKQIKGSSYYNINKLQNSTFKIQLKTMTVGIRGTNFIVELADTTRVFLRQGSLEINSLKDEFKLYVQEQEKEFEDYKNQMYEEYEAFKHEGKNYVLKAKTKSFFLETNSSLSLDENTNSAYQDDGYSEDKFLDFEI